MNANFSLRHFKCIAMLLFAIAMPSVMSAQSMVTVSGTVTDASTSEPLVGVSVKEKGTDVIVVTNIDGEYAVKVKTGATLVFSFIGYEPKEMTAPANGKLNVALDVNSEILDEVVVVGYGRQKKVNLTGAVATVDGKDLEDRPLANAVQMLQGTMPNVGVTLGGGNPSAQASINVRGITSINGGDPLVMIDGVPGNLNSINPRDIESISVLKDASSAAIYGARAAFGVVLVTTKTAKDERFTVSYNNNFAWAKPATSTDWMTNGYDVVTMVDEAMRRTLGVSYTGYTEEDMQELYARRNDVTEHPDRPWIVVKNHGGREIYNYYGNYDWWNTFFNSSVPSQQHNISISGKSEKISFLLSGNFYHKDGIMKIKEDKYNTMNIRSKIDAQISPYVKVWNNTSFNYQSYKYWGLNGDNNFINIGCHALPCYAPWNPDGTATYRTEKNNYTIADGLFANLLTNAGGTSALYQLITTTGLKFDFGKNVNLNFDYTYAPYSTHEQARQCKAEYSIEPGVKQTVGHYATDRFTEQMYLLPHHIVNGYANYKQTFAGKHNLEVTAGFNYEHKQYYLLKASADNLTSTVLNDLNLATSNRQNSGGRHAYSLMGYFARVNYNYADRYLFEVNARYDGTSRFKKGSRYGFFPSVSAAWRVSQENFFEPARNVMNEMKIRASYGSLGNQNVSGYYPYIPTMSSSLGSWLVNDQKVTQYGVPASPSEDLTWERVYSTNFGLDLGFFNNRLTFSGDIYQRDTKDMLVPGVVLPGVYGGSSPQQNAGDLRTRGFELTIGWRDEFNLAGKPFSYNVSASLGDSKSVITKFDNPNKSLTSHYVGETLGEIWGFCIDIFQSDAEAAEYTSRVNQDLLNQKLLQSPLSEWNHYRGGDVKYYDLNGDNVIDYGKNTADDPGDRKIIGNRNPRYNYSFSLGANWNGIDFNAFFQGIGRKHWYPTHEFLSFWGPISRPYASFIPQGMYDEYWREDNTDAYFPILRGYMALDDGGSLKQNNDRYLQNVGYLRLKNLTVGYTLPQNLTKKIHVEKLRVYFSGDNLWTTTPMHSKYLDPEGVAFNYRMGYPVSKTFSFGIDLTI